MKMEIAAESLERIVVFEHVLYPKAFEGQWSNRLFKSHEKIREKMGKPPTFLAASKLAKSVREGDRVILSTGWVVPTFLPRGEFDGPLGTVSLARAISVGLKAHSVFVTEEAMTPVLENVSGIAGLRVVPFEDMSKFKGMGVASTEVFPVESIDESKKRARALLDKINPSAVIAIEKAGRNEKGVYHTGLGHDFSASQAKVDYLVDEARNRGILTIGIGDLGNEIGFGSFREDLAPMHPFGAKCQCPCGGGIMTVVETEVPVFAACSNWGGYAVSACLSGILKDSEVLHDSATERRMFEAAMRTGTVDCIYMRPQMTEHSIDVEVHIHVLELLRAIVQQRRKSLERLSAPTREV